MQFIGPLTSVLFVLLLSLHLHYPSKLSHSVRLASLTVEFASLVPGLWLFQSRFSS